MQLKTLIENLGVLEVDGPLNREISGLAYDVRRVCPGSAYVATPTHLGDGHQHIEEAVARGAVAIICQHSRVRRHRRATCIEVRDSKLALAEAARVFYQDPSSHLKVVAVVGGHGRVATARILKQLLENTGIRTGLIGSHRQEIGDRWLPSGKHFPEGLEVNSMLAEMVRIGSQACVLELGRKDLGNRSLSGLKLNTLVLANFGAAESMAENETTVQLARSLSNLPLCQRQACAVVNIDEAAGRSQGEVASMEVQLTYGLAERAAVRATSVRLGPKNTSFQLVLGNKQVQCKVPCAGRQNVYAVLAAAGAALNLGLDAESIGASLNNLAPLPGNLEAVSGDAPFHVYVDGASSSAVLAETLQSVRELTPGRVILVIGANGRSTARERFEMGRAAGEAAELTILTTDNPGAVSPAEIAGVMAQGLEQTRGARFVFEADRAKAILRALGMAKAGDAVLIAGKGERACQELADTIVPFDDRDCARECLESFPTEIPGRGINVAMMV